MATAKGGLGAQTCRQMLDIAAVFYTQAPPKTADRRIALNICIIVKGLSPFHSAQLRRALPAKCRRLPLGEAKR